jgi:hypothetical protein
MKRIICLLVVCSLASMAQADLVVDFGADYVSGGNQTLTADGTTLNDIGGPSGQFYLAASSTPFVCEDLEGDFPYDSITGPEKTDHTAAVWWAPGGSWTYDTMGADDVLFTLGNYIMSIDKVYFFVKNGDNYYRSPLADPDARINVDPADPKEYTRDMLDDSAWVEFDPTIMADVAGGLTSSIDDLDDITEFGMFYEDSSGNSFIDGFEAYAVPEPATMSLLAMGGLAALIRRRRK